MDYLKIYQFQWRGRKIRTTAAQKDRVNEVLEFCDAHFDMLS